MRADEAIQTNPYLVGGVVIETDYINQLRYERLMAKARYFFEKLNDLRHKEFWSIGEADRKSYAVKHRQCQRIAEAYEERAKRIKEGM